MAIPQEVITALQSEAQPLAKARFLLSSQRQKAATDLVSAASNLVHNSVESAKLNNDIVGLVYQIISGNVPESEELPIMTELAEKVRLANVSVPQTKLEKGKLAAAVLAIAPIASDETLDNELQTVATKLVALAAILDAYFAAGQQEIENPQE